MLLIGYIVLFIGYLVFEAQGGYDDGDDDPMPERYDEHDHLHVCRCVDVCRCQRGTTGTHV